MEETLVACGKHQLSLEKETGFIGLRQVGEMTGEEAVLINERIAAWSPADAPTFLLCDNRTAKGISPEARREFGASTQLQSRTTYVAIYGGSFEMRAVSNLILTAMRLMGRKVIGSFEADETKARAWLAAKRSAEVMTKSS